MRLHHHSQGHQCACQMEQAYLGESLTPQGYLIGTLKCCFLSPLSVSHLSIEHKLRIPPLSLGGSGNGVGMG